MPNRAIPQPFRIRNFSTGKQSHLVLAFKVDGTLDQSVACLQSVLLILDDAGASLDDLGATVTLADAHHIAGSESQYTLAVSGTYSYVQEIYRRLVRAPDHEEARTLRHVCETTTLGRRFTFADGEISTPLMVLAMSTNLAQLLALRLGREWPSPHSELSCGGVTSGGHPALA
jgi:hypothetical protein